jgi:hypothetical protein
VHSHVAHDHFEMGSLGAAYILLFRILIPPEKTVVVAGWGAVNCCGCGISGDVDVEPRVFELA